MQTNPDLAASFAGRLSELTELTAGLWNGSRDDAPELERVFQPLEQARNERQAEQLADEVEQELQRCPADPAARADWREGLRSRLAGTDLAPLGLGPAQRGVLTSPEHFESTRAFVAAARGLDPGLEVEEVVQALRNVWIANSLQSLLGLPVETTPAVFAYSMLYPTTDNFLDDPEVVPARKRRFCERLTRRLAGERVRPDGAHESTVFGLVERVERQFPRERFPAVHASLRAIHAGQVESLEQQAAEAGDGSAALLRISVVKGGSSVLADGYLVAGRLARADAEFCFGYGFFLQLIDDLQDVATDRACGHRTLFSALPAGQPLDGPTGRTWQLMRTVLERRFDGPDPDELADLILTNCSVLMAHSVALHEPLFSPGFARHLEARHPVRFAWIRTQSELGRERFRRTRRLLLERTGLSSLLVLLD